MSYILDALKKSEQERGSGHIPNVQTVHTSSLSYRNKKSYWPYALITIVVLNLAAIVYFYLNNSETQATNIHSSTDNDGVNIQPLTSTKTTAINKNNIDTNQSTASTTDRESVPAVQQNTSFDFESPDSKQLVESSPINITNNKTEDSYSQPTASDDYKSQNYTTEIIDFYDLPGRIKRQLPTITVSAHVYSDNPLQRSIVVNNNFLEEGELILDDLILQEITKDGAIMNYQGTVFRYGIVSGWQ